jgi:RNA polymerase sigma factor (sigma-70 family)
VDRPAEELLRRCLEGLTERERTILMLTFYAEQSSGAIASSLGLETGHVRVIRHRGMSSLRDCVGGGQELLQ